MEAVGVWKMGTPEPPALNLMFSRALPPTRVLHAVRVQRAQGPAFLHGTNLHYMRVTSRRSVPNDGQRVEGCDGCGHPRRIKPIVQAKPSTVLSHDATPHNALLVWPSGLGH